MNMDFIALFCLVVFAILATVNFVKWMRDEVELNACLGWVCAFAWCAIAIHG